MVVSARTIWNRFHVIAIGSHSVTVWYHTDFFMATFTPGFSDSAWQHDNFVVLIKQKLTKFNFEDTICTLKKVKIAIILYLEWSTVKLYRWQKLSCSHQWIYWGSASHSHRSTGTCWCKSGTWVGTRAVKRVQACASSTVGATNNSELDKWEKLHNRKWNPISGTLWSIKSKLPKWACDSAHALMLCLTFCVPLLTNNNCHWSASVYHRLETLNHKLGLKTDICASNSFHVLMANQNTLAVVCILSEGCLAPLSTCPVWSIHVCVLQRRLWNVVKRARNRSESVCCNDKQGVKLVLLKLWASSLWRHQQINSQMMYQRNQTLYHKEMWLFKNTVGCICGPSITS